MKFIKSEILRLLRVAIPPNSQILDVGCGNGEMLQQLQPSWGIGLDIDQSALSRARPALPQVSFLCQAVEEFSPPQGQTFDYILLSGVVEQLDDIDTVFKKLKSFSPSATRLVIVSYSRLWQPFIRIAELLELRKRTRWENWIPPDEIDNLLAQSQFEVVTCTHGVLAPVYIPVLSRFLNRCLAPLPIFRAFTAVTVTVARSLQTSSPLDLMPSISVIVAARNESGNIRELIRRVPVLSDNQEILFVEGNSRDDTWEHINTVIAEMNGLTRGMRLKVLKQPGIGKGDAVRTGFEAATGDILIILDADLSVPPEELPRFIDCLRNGVCEFANGSRLIYPMDKRAMQFLNIIGNRLFGIAFTFLLGQQIRDTLCGTKALWARDYRKIATHRNYFGDFDPFGDFDLLFGASRLNLHIRDVPVHYKERTYGSTNIARFRHGLLLLRMTFIAARRLRFV